MVQAFRIGVRLWLPSDIPPSTYKKHQPQSVKAAKYKLTTQLPNTMLANPNAGPLGRGGTETWLCQARVYAKTVSVMQGHGPAWAVSFQNPLDGTRARS